MLMSWPSSRRGGHLDFNRQGVQEPCDPAAPTSGGGRLPRTTSQLTHKRKSARIHIRADSSAGRARPLQGRGQRFDPSSAHLVSRFSFDIRPRIRHRPTEFQEVFLDGERAPFSRPVIHTRRARPLSSFAVPAIKDHADVGIVGEGLHQTCVNQLIIARNDVQKSWHAPSVSRVETPRRDGIICAHPGGCQGRGCEGE